MFSSTRSCQIELIIISVFVEWYIVDVAHGDPARQFVSWFWGINSLLEYGFHCSLLGKLWIAPIRSDHPILFDLRKVILVPSIPSEL